MWSLNPHGLGFHLEVYTSAYVEHVGKRGNKLIFSKIEPKSITGGNVVVESIESSYEAVLVAAARPSGIIALCEGVAATILCGYKGVTAVCSCSKAMVFVVGSDMAAVLAARWPRGSAVVLRWCFRS